MYRLSNDCQIVTESGDDLMRLTLPFTFAKDKRALPLFLFLSCIVFILFSSVVSAAELHLSTFMVPYRSYTFDYWGNAVEGPLAYLPKRVISAADLGLNSLKQPKDIVVDETNNAIYIVDTGNNRIIQLDMDWQVVRIIDKFINNGVEDKFSSPASIAVTKEQHIYVADTNNGRIVHLDQDGNLVRILGSPHIGYEQMFSDTFKYKPFKVGVNNKGYIYVLSEDFFEGIITLDPDGIFRGIIGAPKVVVSLSEYIWYRLSTDEQKARRNLFLPVEYSGFTLDNEGFLYTTVASDEGEPIRKLNPAGKDTLRRFGFFRPIGDITYTNMWQQSTYYGRSMFVDVTVFPNGTYSVLDRTRSRIYTYDFDGNLLYMFGYRGRAHGQISRGIAIDHIGLDLVVIDDERSLIMIFEPTEYTKLIWTALEHYDKGEFTEEEEVWRQVLKLNANYDLAYTGIGRSVMLQEKFADAMYYYKLGNNRSGYSDAFMHYRKMRVEENFTWIMIAIVLIILLIVYWPRLFKKEFISERQAAVAQEAAWLALSESNSFKSKFLRLLSCLKYGFHVIFHPFDGFYEIKYRKRGSLPAAFVIIILVTITYTLMHQYTGFLFNYNDPKDLNIIVEFASVLLPFFLWAGVNWAFTTLMSGKGTFKEIIISTAYALLPIVLINLPLIIVSNYLILDEGAFYYLLISIAMLWSGALIFIGAVMITHEYSIGKSIFTTILTLAGMVFTVFLGMLILNLCESVYRFVNEIFTEIVYRI